MPDIMFSTEKHYDEQMIVEQGWGNGDPRVRLAQLSEAMLRECRFVVGVKLHTAGWALEHSQRFFRDACFQSPALVTEETLRGTQMARCKRFALARGGEFLQGVRTYRIKQAISQHIPVQLGQNKRLVY